MLAAVLLLLAQVVLTPGAGVFESHIENAATVPAPRAGLKTLLSRVRTKGVNRVKAALGGVGRVFGGFQRKNNAPIEGEK